MALGAAWKGQLRISLVSVPVEAYSASAPGGGKISLNQLHEKCHSRIRYVKSCPIHGEVPNSEIVSGFEYAKGQYVVIDPDELEKLRTEADRNLDVRAFIKSDVLDPIYYSGKSHYLLPSGKGGDKPYQLLHQAMIEKRVHAVAQVVISKREELVIVRPVGDLLVVNSLLYASQVKDPKTWEHHIPEAQASKQETQLVGQLIEQLTEKKFDMAQFSDTYTEKLRVLIDAKVEGREIVAPTAVKFPESINLLDAIRQSIKQKASPGKKPTLKLRKLTRVAAARRTKERKKTG